MGVLCPVGLDAATTWEALINSKSGINYITRFDPEPFITRFAGEVTGFKPTDYIPRRDARHMDRFTQLAIAASLQAVEQAKIRINSTNQDKIGVIIGSSLGGLATLSQEVSTLQQKGPRRVSPFLIPMMAADIASARVSITLGARGPNFSTTSSCSSGADAIGLAYEMIKRGDTLAMVAGGSEAAVTPVGLAAFNAIRALSIRNNEPQLASRPFDRERDGFVLGEGAGIMILENENLARRRGANILAEIVGYGATSDAYHITHPTEDGRGIAQAIRIALNKAHLNINQIDYINAHGTSTPLNDRTETKAIKTVFGKAAYNVPISSTKSMMGHLIGAGGAVEAAVCVMVIQQGIIPPTINLTHPDPECDLDYVPNVARRAEVTTTLSHAFGFGGHNSVLALRRYSEVSI
ncbi:MAG: beta-ketoacyl-ACP synthase II [Dehalococcoidales bacterium]|nr:beta-ketoacyl-ACP synthase II [Dehalococcoidales bacterium]